MTKSQIIEILQQYVDFTEYERGQVNNRLYNAIADAILALPIEMPTEEEIKRASTSEVVRHPATKDEKIAFIAGAAWMKDEIIRRNK
jgi:hypothetical protein